MVRPISHIFSYVVFTLLLLGVSLTHTSCDGDDKSPYELGPYKWGDDFWLPYVYFKEGTWWVYESTFEGETRYDTITVTSSDFETIRYDDGNTRNWKVTTEWFKYTMNSTRNGYTIHESPHIGILDATDTSHYRRFLLIRTVWNNGTCRPFFKYEPNFEKTGTGSTSTTFDGMKDGIEISGNVYNDVVVFTVDGDRSWDDYATAPVVKYYWGKDIGILKREHQRTGEEWHLVDYYIAE